MRTLAGISRWQLGMVELSARGGETIYETGYTTKAGKTRVVFKGVGTMALDPKTHNLLVDTSDFVTPADTKQSNARPTAKPGTFRLPVYGR